MKLHKFLSIALVAAALAAATTSCEDMLTVDTGDKSTVNANDTLYSYLGILKNVQNLAERIVILNELRGDLITPTSYITDTLYAIANFDDPEDGSCSMLAISDFYAVINNCNLYIANADTAAIKNNEQYMIPEFAQVQAIRAWTYLKLIELYGEVPFIAEPIASLDVVKNFDYEANLVTKDNLVDRLLEEGLADFVDTEYPTYGSYDNGDVSIASRMCFIPVRLVLGDLYLTRGASVSDYETAATYYYEFLRENAYTVPTDYVRASQVSGVQAQNSSDTYSYTNSGWGAWGSEYTYASTNEVISLIPSSANKQFGTIITRTADIFGYTPTSSQSTETTTDDDGDETSETSGSISVSRNYQAQVTPSNGYKTISMAQTYVYYEDEEDFMTYDCGDTRYNYATESITYDGDAYLLAAKAARGSTFYYSTPIYRKTVVWLRLAEAINRAGHPAFAFAILKDGLNANNYPTYSLRTDITIRTDEDGNNVLDEDGVAIRDTLTYIATTYNYGAWSYIDSTEIADFFLDFTSTDWESNYGIHARGCGYGAESSWDTGITSITGYNDSIYFDYAPRLLEEGVDVETASEDDIINAVENIISDELALEASFEGYRFPDLVRMAQHKNASGYSGTEWLATKVADRNIYTVTDVEGTTTTGERDTDLYTKLLDTSNWFFTKPAWTVD